MFWCSRTLKEHLELEGSKVSWEFKVSSPHTTLHSTEPVKDFIVEGAQLKAGKENLLSITVPACIWQEPPCKKQQQTAIWRARHTFKRKRVCSGLARWSLISWTCFYRQKSYQGQTLLTWKGWNVRREFSYSWRKSCFGLDGFLVFPTDFCQKTPELTYTKIMQIPHHICKAILTLNSLN